MSHLRKLAENPFLYLTSFIPNERLQCGDVAAIMCVWDEQDNVALALKSTKGFVSRYIVVDKNGDTISEIKKVQKQYNLDIEYHVKPRLTLREARLFAASRITEPWILIQDGDELINQTSKLRRHMRYPNIVLKSRKNVIIKDLHHTQSINNGYHSFLYHNNKTLKPHWKPRPDLPDYEGRPVYLSDVIRINLSGLKSPRRLYYYHRFWVRYQTSGLMNRYPRIEDFVSNHLRENVTEQDIERWYTEYTGSAIPYDHACHELAPELMNVA